MSDTNPNTPTVEELSASVARLEKALAAERAAHKATKEAAKQAANQFRARIASGFGLGEDADDEAILARLGDVEKTIAEATAAIVKERDEAVKRAADIESRWASEKVDTALRLAFEKSGAKPEHLEDFLLLARPLFGVDERGEVRTRKDAKETIPGVDPVAWIVSELRAKRPHYWPRSVGGGATGGGFIPSPIGDDSCFKPGPTWNLTAQFEYEARFGAAAADAARRRYGGTR